MAGVKQNRYKTDNGCIKHLPQTGFVDFERKVRFNSVQILTSISKIFVHVMKL